jgi:Ca2+-transporting ATPase
LFTSIIFSQLFRSFGARSTTRIFWEVGVFSNLWLLAVILLTTFLQVSLHYIPLAQQMFALQPLSLEDLLFVLPFTLIPITVIEVKKLVLRYWSRDVPAAGDGAIRA